MTLDEQSDDEMPSMANLIKHFTIINYDTRVVLTTNLPILRLFLES